MRNEVNVMVTDYGNIAIPDAVMRAYGVSRPEGNPDYRRSVWKEYRDRLRTLEENLNAVASHNWIMGRDIDIL